MSHDEAGKYPYPWGNPPLETVVDLGVPGWRGRTTITGEGETHCFAIRENPNVTDREIAAGLRNVVAATSVNELRAQVRAQVDLEEGLRAPYAPQIYLPSPDVPTWTTDQD